MPRSKLLRLYVQMIAAIAGGGAKSRSGSLLIRLENHKGIGRQQMRMRRKVLGHLTLHELAVVVRQRRAKGGCNWGGVDNTHAKAGHRDSRRPGKVVPPAHRRGFVEWYEDGEGVAP